MIRYETIKVTPKLATKWLGSNMENNRKLKAGHVATLASDMKAGLWKETGEAIKFNPMKQLIDGQHRLSAIVASGCTIELLVAWDVPSDAIMAIDTGRSRNAGDVLHIKGGCQFPRHTPTLIRRIDAWKSGTESQDLKKRRGMSAQEISMYLEKHPDLELHIQASMRLMRSVNPNTLTQGEWAFAHWLLSQTDAAAAEDFLTQLSELTCPKESPIRSLFGRLTGLSLPTRIKINYIIRAWNAWRRGEKDVALKVRQADEEKIPELV